MFLPEFGLMLSASSRTPFLSLPAARKQLRGQILEARSPLPLVPPAHTAPGDTEIHDILAVSFLQPLLFS